MPLGINLVVLIGKTVPTPVPRLVMEAFQKAEITHSDQDVSGFQIDFKVGRSGRGDIKDYQIIKKGIKTFECADCAL